MRAALLICMFAFLSSCQPEPRWTGSLETLLRSQPDRFGTVMDNADAHRLQIIYTQIDRDADNRPTFRRFTYRLDATEYFYPASTVKLPVAALALEKAARLGLSRDAAMLTGSAADFQTESLVDETSPTGLPSVANYVRRILLVSDNDAYNRLYEFVGQKEINETLRARGFENARIVHRLAIPLNPEQNRHTNPVTFVEDGVAVHEQAATISGVDFTARSPVLVGTAEIVNGERIEGAKDFATKNAFPLDELHDTIRAILFPGAESEARRFELSPEDRAFLLLYMSEYPGESGIAAYADADEYPEGYVKFLMFGGEAAKVPREIRIFNKVGDAFGFLTDAAYIVDFENGVEFLLAATIYVNSNETFNDDTYEYDEVGLPFLRDLGQAIYEVELERPRQHRPDLADIAALRRP